MAELEGQPPKSVHLTGGAVTWFHKVSSWDEMIFLWMIMVAKYTKSEHLTREAVTWLHKVMFI